MSNQGNTSPEKLIAQINQEETVAEAFSELVEMGDSAIPALLVAIKKPGNDRELLFSVLSSIESDAAFTVLSDLLFKTQDKSEQSTLALLLAKDGRNEIAPWLIKQLPTHWEKATWWKKVGEVNSEHVATMLAALISLDVDPAYLQWFETAMDGENPKQLAAAEFIGELLDEVDITEYEDN